MGSGDAPHAMACTCSVSASPLCEALSRSATDLFFDLPHRCLLPQPVGSPHHRTQPSPAALRGYVNPPDQPPEMQ